MKELTIEQQYIKRVIDDTQKRIELLKSMQAEYNEKLDTTKDGTQTKGLFEGFITAWEQEIQYLEGQNQFLKRALEE